MKATHNQIKTVEIVKPVDPVRLPDGNHQGVWGGYVVMVEIGSKMHRIETTVGIRTTNAPCVVRVRGGVVTIETTERPKP